MAKRNSPKILILGSNGYIGRHLRLRLLELNYRYTLGDFQKQSIDEDENYVQIDVLDKIGLNELLPSHDIVFCMAGLTGTLQGFSDYVRFIEVNEIGLLNCLDVIRTQGLKTKVILPSTRLIYRGQKGKPLKEDAETEFKTIYAMNKYACEKYLEMYRNIFGLTYAVFRICVPYGNELGDEYSYGTLGQMFNQANTDKKITVYGDGSQRRSLMHITDLTSALLHGALSDATNNDTFNISGPDTLSIAEIAEAVATLFEIEVEYGEWPTNLANIESGDTMFDTTKFERAAGVLYRRDFQSWLDAISKKP
jgi:UDP-glucose 4-epimerase